MHDIQFTARQESQGLPSWKRIESRRTALRCLSGVKIIGILDGKVTKFKNDREYTYESLIKQLNLLELHIRDGSYRECSCTPQKHAPTIEGLAEEAVSFTEDPVEKKFMQRLGDAAANLRRGLKSKDKITDEEADEIRGWAKEMRKRIDLALWEGELPKSSRKDEIEDKGGKGYGSGEVYGNIIEDDEPITKPRNSDISYVRTTHSDVGNDVRFVDVSPANARRTGLD